VVVADPARAGLGRDGIPRVAATGATRVVLVSCDAASLGRDTAGLVAAGYRHEESVVIDMFGHTGHVEVVTRFDREA
jgi:23S rRNA (uracil1939-C5)-methyltransferase